MTRSRPDQPDEPRRPAPPAGGNAGAGNSAGGNARSGNPARRAAASRQPEQPAAVTPGARPAASAPDKASPKLKFPHRDADGRVDTLPDLLVGVVVWLVVALAILLGIEGIGAALGQGFGGTSGWIAGILAVWLFAEEYRAWRPVPARLALAVLSAVVGGTIGLILTNVISALPKLVSGFVGVAVATLVYAVLWYFGVRWAARRSGER